MQLLAQIIFWASTLALLHTYVLYPLLMWGLARGKVPNRTVFSPDDLHLPMVSVLMAVYNEERVIVEKMESLKRLHYPSSRLRIFIGSDGSEDQTVSLIEQATAGIPNVFVTPFPVRRGKPPVINDLARMAADPEPGHVFLLTDASVILEPDTLYHLVKHFKNERIAVVDAHMQSKGLRQVGISKSEEQYLSGEVRLKHHEGLAWGMMMGPFGGCYALRAALFEPIPPRSLVDDFWLVFRVLEQGGQAINDLDAHCLEGATHRVSDEYRRKKRIAAGSFQNLARFKHWVLPPVTRLGFAFFSHKVLRWFGGFFLLFIFLSAGLLSFYNQFYRWVFWVSMVGALVVLAMNAIQSRLGIGPIALIRNLAYFLAMNLALIDGFFKWLRGIRVDTWQPTARE